MKHRQEYRMKLKRLLKRYEKVRKKASKLYEKITEAYEEHYLSNDVMVCKQIMNSLYGKCVTTIYSDTDSIKDSAIYKDFNKKSEV